MQTKIISKKHILFSIPLILAGTLVLVGFALADNCPSITTVTGTTVNFVGEVTDMGGAPTNSVWFEYGQTISYGQKTAEKTLTQKGTYCITVSGLSSCTTYHYRAVARNSAGTSYGEDKTFTTTCGPTVDLKADNSDGPITISYGGSATLTWNSTNANYCSASGGWLGSKTISGSESTGNLTTSKSYTLTCTGSGGSSSDTVSVNIRSAPAFTITKLARNFSDGTSLSDLVNADPGDTISFSIEVTAGNSSIQSITLRDVLPDKMTFQGNLKVDGISFVGNIATGLNLGDLVPYQSRTVTFDAVVSGSDQFVFGETLLVNTVLISGSNVSGSDTARVNVKKSAVAGATDVSTGLTNNIFVDSIILPLMIATLVIWLLKSRIVKFEQWLDGRKNQYQSYKSKKVLQIMVKKIRLQELLKKYRFTKN